MIEQFNEMPKRKGLKVDIPLLQAHRLHLGSFTQVCVVMYSLKYYSNLYFR